MRCVQSNCVLMSLLVVGLYSGVQARDGRSVSEIRALSSSYADCVLKKPNRAELAKAFIVGDLPSSSLIKGKNAKLIDGDCLVKEARAFGGVSMRFPGELYRYALAGALVRRDFPAAIPNFSQVASLVHRPIPVMDEAKLPKKEKAAAEVRAEFAKDVMDGFMGRYAECVVRQSPVESHSLLLKGAATPEEGAAFKKMETALSDCMPADTTLKFGREQLKGAMAVAFYRLADAARSSAPKLAEKPDA